MKKKLFVFCSLLFFNICIFANAGENSKISDTHELNNNTEQVNSESNAINIEMIYWESSTEANEVIHMCTASATKNGVTIEVTAPCSKIVEAAKVLLQALN